MANQNLSQFGENTSVSDADYTFVWDSAASISKKVSRNSWLNSGTLTSDAPVTISQTWNAGSNVMTALKVVATDTSSGATSNLLELWAGSTPALDFAVTKAGAMQAYGTYSSSGENYARLALACDSSGNATISTQALGTGTAGTVSINGVPVGLGLLNVSTSVAIGTGALAANTSALGGNTAVGNGSLLTATNIYWSTAIGYRALAGLNAFSNSNVALGYEAGSQITSGANFQCSSSVFIGYNTKALGNNQNNQIVIGASAIGIGDNSVVLGNDSITKTALKGNVGIGTTSPTSKLHVAGNASPSITVDNTLATGASQLLFKNTVVTGDTDGIFLNGSTQTGFGGNGSLNIKATTGPLAFHTASVTNALSIAQNGTSTHAGQLIFAPDNTYNIGANGANRPQNIFVAQTVRANAFQLNSLSHIYGTVEGIIGLYNNSLSDFNRLQFGGATDAFPAVARDGAGIKFTGAAAGSTSWIKVPPVAVSALPLAATAGAGARAFVNDASTPVFGMAVTGGGAVLVPVYSNGSAWNVG